MQNRWWIRWCLVGLEIRRVRVQEDHLRLHQVLVGLGVRGSQLDRRAGGLILERGKSLIRYYVLGVLSFLIVILCLSLLF